MRKPRVIYQPARKYGNARLRNKDGEFDSGLEYELSVLKNYVGGLLEIVKIKMPDEIRARTLSTLLSAILPADPSKVPGDSILRETIGGSLLDY